MFWDRCHEPQLVQGLTPRIKHKHFKELSSTLKNPIPQFYLFNGELKLFGMCFWIDSLEHNTFNIDISTWSQGPLVIRQAKIQQDYTFLDFGHLEAWVPKTRVWSVLICCQIHYHHHPPALEQHHPPVSGCQVYPYPVSASWQLCSGLI